MKDVYDIAKGCFIFFCVLGNLYALRSCLLAYSMGQAVFLSMSFFLWVVSLTLLIIGLIIFRKWK